MPKPRGYQLVLSLYGRGIITDREANGQLIDLAGESDVAALVSHLSADLLTSVRRVVAETPTTDEGWERMIYVDAGKFTTGPDYDPEIEQATLSAAYRANVEALRDHFKRDPPGG